MAWSQRPHASPASSGKDAYGALMDNGKGGF